MSSVNSKIRKASGGDLSLADKLRALWQVVTFSPAVTASIILFSFFAALLQGVGLSFLVPVVEVIQADDPAQAGGFAAAYATLGIPFTLGFVLLGAALVLAVRYVSTFLVGWFRVALQIRYQCHLQRSVYDGALNGRVTYFDQHGSDDILNAIVTQAGYAGKAIRDFVRLFEQALLAVTYLAIVVYLRPVLALGALAVFGGLTLLLRYVLSAGYAVGDAIAEANERIQETAQAGTQGIRDIKLYTKTDDMRRTFDRWIDTFAAARIGLARNEEAMDKFYKLGSDLMVIGLFYVALAYTTMGLGELGVFLFAMSQLAPKVSQVNHFFYKIEGRLPHLVRTQAFVRGLKAEAEHDDGDRPTPTPATPVEFDDVSFAYETDEGEDAILRDVSFSIDRGEFVAFVGQSGAGKSTVAALLARLYEPDTGEIRANGVPISEIDLESWRLQVAFVRQDPFVFDDTLRANVTMWDEDASEDAVREACEIAHVTEFLDELPDGLDTLLGEDGVRLSGGQRQRVAFARALLKDADVLVLDEATSDLDTGIEERVQQSIEEMDRGYAILTIAHRLSTVVNADRIYALEDGRVVESGDHESLVKGGGTYEKLYATQ